MCHFAQLLRLCHVAMYHYIYQEILTLTQKLTVADVDVATRSQIQDSLKRVINQFAEENDNLKKMIETYAVRQVRRCRHVHLEIVL